MSVEEYRKAAVDAVRQLSVDVESRQNSKQSKKKTFSSWLNLHTQTHGARATRKTQV